MAIVDWPQDMTTVIGRTGPHHRVGGYYPNIQSIEEAANLLDFDVIVPPKAKHGFYMVPAPANNDQAAHALIESGRELGGDHIIDGAHRLLRDNPEEDGTD